MILKTISFSHSYEYTEYGLKRWNKTGIEAELGENEDPIAAHATLLSLVNDLKSATIATLEETKGTQIRDVEEPVDKIASWKQVISMCTSITALERFKPQVDREQNQELTDAYNNKLKQLQ